MRSLDYITVTGKRQAGARSAPPPYRAGGGWVWNGSGYPLGGTEARSARAQSARLPPSTRSRRRKAAAGGPGEEPQPGAARGEAAATGCGGFAPDGLRRGRKKRCGASELGGCCRLRRQERRTTMRALCARLRRDGLAFERTRSDAKRSEAARGRQNPPALLSGGG